MERTQRAGWLAAAARTARPELLALAEAVAADAHVDIRSPATPGSVMVELDVAVGTFCLADVVVTEALVAVDGEVGWASVMGFDEHAAVAAAILDAWAAGSADGCGQVIGFCRGVQQDQDASRAAEAVLIAATEVA